VAALTLVRKHGRLFPRRVVLAVLSQNVVAILTELSLNVARDDGQAHSEAQCGASHRVAHLLDAGHLEELYQSMELLKQVQADQVTQNGADWVSVVKELRDHL